MLSGRKVRLGFQTAQTYADNYVLELARSSKKKPRKHALLITVLKLVL